MSDDKWLEERTAEVESLRAALVELFRREGINPAVAAIAMAETINVILRTAPPAVLDPAKVRQMRNILVAIIRYEPGEEG